MDTLPVLGSMVTNMMVSVRPVSLLGAGVDAQQQHREPAVLAQELVQARDVGQLGRGGRRRLGRLGGGRAAWLDRSAVGAGVGGGPGRRASRLPVPAAPDGSGEPRGAANVQPATRMTTIRAASTARCSSLFTFGTPMLVVRSSRPDRDWAVIPDGPLAPSCRSGSLAAVARSRAAQDRPPRHDADDACWPGHQDAQRARSHRRPRGSPDPQGSPSTWMGSGGRRLQACRGAPEAQRARVRVAADAASGTDGRPGRGPRR